jgi:hypothetical protein
MGTDEAAITSQKVEQFPEVNGNTQGASRVEQVGYIDEHSHTLR